MKQAKSKEYLYIFVGGNDTAHIIVLAGVNASGYNCLTKLSVQCGRGTRYNVWPVRRGSMDSEFYVSQLLKTQHPVPLTIESLLFWKALVDNSGSRISLVCYHQAAARKPTFRSNSAHRPF